MQGRKIELTEKEIDRLVDAYEDGIGTPLLAQRFKICPEKIIRYLKKRKIPIRMRGKQKPFHYGDPCD